MNQEKIGFHQRIMASVCHHCPLCKHARNNPESMLGKILHHKIHADHCPFWKAEKTVYRQEAGED
jgi:hypothetical protein